MASDILSSQNPNKLTDDYIRSMREYIKKCPNPYTDEDVDNLPFDGYIDPLRMNAYAAIVILTRHGISLSDEDE